MSTVKDLNNLIFGADSAGFLQEPVQQKLKFGAQADLVQECVAAGLDYLEMQELIVQEQFPLCLGVMFVVALDLVVTMLLHCVLGAVVLLQCFAGLAAEPTDVCVLRGEWGDIHFAQPVQRHFVVLAATAFVPAV